VILADTSLWVDHFRRGNFTLSEWLERGEVATHPFVIGELACGNLRARQHILEMLRALPAVAELSHDEAMQFIESHRLHGRGLGWIDVHLLASSMLAGARLLTLDTRLGAAYAAIARK
jgi:predicted nucleic acid-binding protein